MFELMKKMYAAKSSLSPSKRLLPDCNRLTAIIEFYRIAELEINSLKNKENNLNKAIAQELELISKE